MPDERLAISESATAKTLFQPEVELSLIVVAMVACLVWSYAHVPSERDKLRVHDGFTAEP